MYELQQTLHRSKINSDFIIENIELLINRYDQNGDHEISFDEFFDFFYDLNEEYENFLMIEPYESSSYDFDEFN